MSTISAFRWWRDTEMAETVLFEKKPDRPPPLLASGPSLWAREHLFGSVTNTIVTLLCLLALYQLIPPVLRLGIAGRQFRPARTKPSARPIRTAPAGPSSGPSTRSCSSIRLPIPMRVWRPVLAFAILGGLLFWLLWPTTPHKPKVGLSHPVRSSRCSPCHHPGRWLGLPGRTDQ